MKLDKNESAFLLGMLIKRLELEPDCKPTKKIYNKIITEFPVIAKMLNLEVKK